MARKPKKTAADTDDKAAGTDNPAAEDTGADGGAQAEGAAAVPALVINAQYTKDLSFEAPAAPEIFAQMQNQQPDITINIDVKAQPMKEPDYEVLLHIRAECRVAETTAFILELSYAGHFAVNVPTEQLQPVLLIECPRLLFPFARNILADASRDGGFPPLMLGPVDFVAMYQNQQRQAEQSAGPVQAP